MNSGALSKIIIIIMCSKNDMIYPKKSTEANLKELPVTNQIWNILSIKISTDSNGL